MVVFVQHGQAIEEVAGIDHEGQEQGLEWIEGSKQELQGHKLHGTSENKEGH